MPNSKQFTGHQQPLIFYYPQCMSEWVKVAYSKNFKEFFPVNAFNNSTKPLYEWKLALKNGDLDSFIQDK